jgi:hypothetical protein
MIVVNREYESHQPFSQEAVRFCLKWNAGARLYQYRAAKAVGPRSGLTAYHRLR